MASRTEFLTVPIAHALGRTPGQHIAIAMEIAGAAIDREREEDTGDRAGHELAHGEHVAAQPERRKNLEHIVVLGRADLKPLAVIESASEARLAYRCLAMAVEHMEHLSARCDALEDLAEGRLGDHWRLLSSVGIKRDPVHPTGSSPSCLLITPSRGRLSGPAGQGPALAGRSFP
jgi:hypothetical protein